MQAELDAMGLATPVRIFGVNAAGAEAGNAQVCEGRSRPWLQDTPAANVTAAWGVTNRDVVMLDGENKVFRTYNLTEQDLANPTYYAELKSILVTAAGTAAAKSPH